MSGEGSFWRWRKDTDLSVSAVLLFDAEAEDDGSQKGTDADVCTDKKKCRVAAGARGPAAGGPVQRTDKSSVLWYLLVTSLGAPPPYPHTLG
jgi:hypothetical protein